MGYTCCTKDFRKTRHDIYHYVAIKQQLACIRYCAKDAHATGMVIFTEQRLKPGFGSKRTNNLNT